MKAKLLSLWESRSPRDRVVIALVAVLAGVLLYAWLIQSASRARANLGTSLATLRAQALGLDRDASELARVRGARLPAAPQTELRAQLQAQVADAGLAGALLRIDATDASHAQVAFGSVAFGDWLAWIAALQAQQVRLETARVEALTTPGLVAVTATFARARPR